MWMLHSFRKRLRLRFHSETWITCGLWVGECEWYSLRLCHGDTGSTDFASKTRQSVREYQVCRKIECWIRLCAQDYWSWVLSVELCMRKQHFDEKIKIRENHALQISVSFKLQLASALNWGTWKKTSKYVLSLLLENFTNWYSKFSRDFHDRYSDCGRLCLSERLPVRHLLWIEQWLQNPLEEVLANSPTLFDCYVTTVTFVLPLISL